VRWLVGRPLIGGMVAVFAGAAALAFPAPCGSSTAVTAAVYNLKAYPLASFVWFPAFPGPGESISLVSTSTDLTSPITAYAWDLADNGPFGAFNDGGPVAVTWGWLIVGFFVILVALGNENFEIS